MKCRIHSLLLLATVLLTGCTTSTQLTSTSWLTSAAIVGVISALVSSLISLIVKDKEYKNDYFKKVIEKRLKAVESLEDATASLRLHYLVKKQDDAQSRYHAFLILPDSQEVFKNAVSAASRHIIWHSKSTRMAFGNLARKVSLVLRQSKELDEAERIELAISEYDLIDNKMTELHLSIARDMLKLYKVEDFLNDKLNAFEHPPSK